MDDQYELAWAAGLFDGEGSIYAVARGRRIIVAIGQSSADGTPEVLVRFQAAVAHLGYINGPYKHGRPARLPHWQWRAAHFEQAQAVIAMLWKFLGSVKRLQAADALAIANAYVRKPTGRPRGTNRWATQHECPHGHAYDEANTRWITKPNGYRYRVCKTCDRERYHAKKK